MEVLENMDVSKWRGKGRGQEGRGGGRREERRRELRVEGNWMNGEREETE